MKYILICDNAHVETGAALCRAERLGIEAQSFYLPETIDDPEDHIKIHEKALWGITPRSFHGPFADLAPGSIDPMIRNVARKRLMQAVDIAMRLNTEQIVFHNGYYPNTSKPATWNKRSIKFFKDVLKATPDNMVFHLENLFENEPSMLSDLIDGIESHRVDICLDIGHAHAFSGMPVPDMIEKLGQRIGYVHMHSNNGRKDEHLCLTKGTLPIKDVCDALERFAPDAVWALETPLDTISEDVEFLRKEGYL